MPAHFEQPYWFFLFPLLLLVYLVFRRWSVVQKQADINNIISVYIPSIPHSENTKNSLRLSYSVWLNWLALLLMITALAQPVTKEKILTNPDTLRDIIFVIDTSVGMSIKDYQLNDKKVARLTLLKSVLTNFSNNLHGNRIGLVVYADDAYTLSPLTRDRGLIEASINRIQPAIAGRQNNLSKALNTVLKQYAAAKSNASIVVFSQGANIVGNTSPVAVAEQFNLKKIKLHIVGLGSSRKLENTGVKLIYDAIDHHLLKKLANITGGEFFWAGKSNNLNAILEVIKQSETIELKKNEYWFITNHYSYVLYFVLLIIFLATIPGFTRRQ